MDFKDKFLHLARLVKHGQFHRIPPLVLRYNDYKEFDALHPSEEELARQRRSIPGRQYRYGIVISAESNDSKKTMATIRSVREQTYCKFEYKVCRNLQEIKDYIASVNADYIIFANEGDIFSKGALWSINRYIKYTKAECLYTDEKKYDSSFDDGNEFVFKPDYALYTLKSFNYIGHFGVFAKSLLKRMDSVDVYELFLRVSAFTKVRHLDKELVFTRMDYVPDYEKELSVVNAFLTDSECDEGYTRSNIEGIYRPIVNLKDTPKVSILIPNKDNVKILKTCLDSIWNKTSYSNYEIVIVENNSEEEQTFAYYEEIKDRVNIVTWVGGWNYAAINNFGYKYTTGEYILLLNSDTEVINPAWIEEMLVFAQKSDIGIVGAKLFFPNGQIQHAGVTVGILGVAGHAFHEYDRDARGYMNRAVSVQELSAVTAACLMIKRSVFDQVGGFNEGYAVAFNDVDLCLRVRKAGFKVIYTPYATLYHHESITRGTDTQSEEKMKRFAGEVDRFKRDWRDFLYGGDPYYNRNLSLENDCFQVAQER